MNKSAIFSDCKKFRYALTRVWDESMPVAMCIGLNPSTANEDTNDNTISNLILILTKLGFGGFHMLNLFPAISPEPDDLRMYPDPVKDNDWYLQHYAAQSETVIFCWGQFRQASYRAKKVIPMFPQAKCFGKNSDGTPMHPRALVYKKGMLHNPQLTNFV